MKNLSRVALLVFFIASIALLPSTATARQDGESVTFTISDVAAEYTLTLNLSVGWVSTIDSDSDFPTLYIADNTDLLDVISDPNADPADYPSGDGLSVFIVSQEELGSFMGGQPITASELLSLITEGAEGVEADDFQVDGFSDGLRYITPDGGGGYILIAPDGLSAIVALSPITPVNTDATDAIFSTAVYTITPLAEAGFVQYDATFIASDGSSYQLTFQAPAHWLRRNDGEVGAVFLASNAETLNLTYDGEDAQATGDAISIFAVTSELLPFFVNEGDEVSAANIYTSLTATSLDIYSFGEPEPFDSPFFEDSLRATVTAGDRAGFAYFLVRDDSAIVISAFGEFARFDEIAASANLLFGDSVGDTDQDIELGAFFTIGFPPNHLLVSWPSFFETVTRFDQDNQRFIVATDDQAIDDFLAVDAERTYLFVAAYTYYTPDQLADAEVQSGADLLAFASDDLEASNLDLSLVEDYSNDSFTDGASVSVQLGENAGRAFGLINEYGGVVFLIYSSLTVDPIDVMADAIVLEPFE